MHVRQAVFVNGLKTENLWRPLEGAWPDTGVILKSGVAHPLI